MNYRRRPTLINLQEECEFKSLAIDVAPPTSLGGNVQQVLLLQCAILLADTGQFPLITLDWSTWLVTTLSPW